MVKISEKCQELLSADMCIDLEHLKTKIESSDIVTHAPLICEVIETLCSYVGDKTDDDVNDYCFSVMSNIENEPYHTLDSIRIAFVRFISDGLHGLFGHQENEAWYPKITLNKQLEPNDIPALDDEFTIFRGCDISEYESGQIGQSWSTSYDVARDFAYKHYNSQDWFTGENRILVSATYNKTDVLFSDQTEYGEYEIVVNINKLSNIRKVI